VDEKERFGAQKSCSCAKPTSASLSGAGKASSVALQVHLFYVLSALDRVVHNVLPNKPLISEAIAVNILAGITGSSSDGLGIALEALWCRGPAHGAGGGISA
jgi:hypothetical protein